MKQILFILLNLVFLQVPLSCMGKGSESKVTENSVSAEIVNPMKVVAPDGVQLSAEEQTEKNFWDFVQKDILPKAEKNSDGVLYHTGFLKVNDAFDSILNFINPAGARMDFNKTKVYKSDLLVLDYTEKDVKSGFAQLKLKFNNRKPREYTVIFK